MRIRDQLRLTTILFVALVIGVLASAVTINGIVKLAYYREATANDISQIASDLVYLSTDYLTSPGEFRLSRWITRFNTFLSRLDSLHPGSSRQASIILQLRTSAGQLKGVFDNVSSVVHNQYRDNPLLYPAGFLRLSWSRLAVQSRSLVMDALRISRATRADADHERNTETVFALSLAGLFIAYFLASFVLLQRRTLDSIRALHEGTAKVGAGDLGNRIKVAANDEIGDLARAFNDMTVRVGESLKARDVAVHSLQEQQDNLERIVSERTAELEGANHELEAFAYAVSHDLRAPLRALSGFSNALLEDYESVLEGDGRDYLHQIAIASSKMGELIDGILRLSRTTRGELNREEVDLSSLAQWILGELQKTEPDRHLTWVVQPAVVARCDAKLMEIVLTNLLGNAWKYTSKTPQPVIRFSEETIEGDRWFCVADNGAGFDMSFTARLFQPFQRLHRQDEFPGIGIGLATVQRIIRRHGGTIRAVGAPGEGANFRFTLSGPQGKEES